MQEYVRLRVYPNKDAQKPIFERLTPHDISIVYPYDTVISAMRALFGDKSVISFDCTLLK